MAVLLGMSEALSTIRQFHETLSFGNRENLVVESRKATEAYRALDDLEVKELVKDSLAGFERSDNYLTCLACLRPGSLNPFHIALIEAEIFSSGFVYSGADQDVATKMVARLESEEKSLTINHLLLCLAWTGNEVVWEAFANWRQESPSWANVLYIPPHAYAKEAGWELTEGGQRRDLFSQTAIPLVTPNNLESRSGVEVGISVTESCPWCERSLTSILKIDGSDPNISFLNLEHRHWEVSTCDVCTCYGLVFANADSSKAHWHSKNQRPSYLPDDVEDFGAFPERPLVLSDQKRHFMESASWTGIPNGHFSQIGGLPTWVQDAEYPACPDCSRTMMFVGQISNEDYDRMMEGIFYAFVCNECCTTATHYQQS